MDILEIINKKRLGRILNEEEISEIYEMKQIQGISLENIDMDKFKLAPGAVEFLDYLKENNIPRTIATMSEWDNVEFYIKEFKLEKWFDLDKIVYSDGTIPGKPAPVPISITL